MKKLHYIILFIAATALTGCQEKPVNAGTEDNVLRIEAISYGIDVKSVVNLGTDPIYAYPFSLSSEFSSLEGQCMLPYMTDGTEYSYKVPQDSQDIIFTSIADGEYTITTATDSETFSASMENNTPGCAGDFVLGSLLASEVTAGSTQSYPVQLKRKVAEINIALRSKKKGSEELVEDLSKFFSKIEVYIPTYGKYAIGTFPLEEGLALDESYSGEINARFTAETIPADDTVSIVAKRFIFPSTGTDPAQIRLVATTLSGNELDITKSMTQSIVANKSYDLTLTLRQQSSDFEFSLEDIEVVDWGEVEIDTDDMITLSVNPSLNVSMTTRSTEDGFVNDFVLGEDDLYLYLIKNNILCEGYPLKQKKISGSSYIYNIPQGNYNLMFSNHDITKEGGEYYYKQRRYVDGVGYIFEDFKDGETSFYDCVIYSQNIFAATPLITGKEWINVGENPTPKTLDVTLERRTNGYRVLVTVEGGIDFTSVCKGIALRLRNNIIPEYIVAMESNSDGYYDYNPIEDDFWAGQLVNPTELRTVEHDNSTYYEVLAPSYLFRNSAYSNTFYLDLLTHDNKTMSFSTSTAEIENGANHTIYMTLVSSAFN